MLIADEKGVANDQFLKLLSRGGLTVPSSPLAEFVCCCFAILDFTSKYIETFCPVNVSKAAASILREYSPLVRFTCIDHLEWGFRFSTKSIINVFFNNKEKIATDLIRRDNVVAFKKRQRTK